MRICYVIYPPIYKAGSVLVKRLSRVQCLHLAVTHCTAAAALRKHHRSSNYITIFLQIYLLVSTVKNQQGLDRRIIT